MQYMGYNGSTYTSTWPPPNSLVNGAQPSMPQVRYTKAQTSIHIVTPTGKCCTRQLRDSSWWHLPGALSHYRSQRIDNTAINQVTLLHIRYQIRIQRPSDVQNRQTTGKTLPPVTTSRPLLRFYTGFRRPSTFEPLVLCHLGQSSSQRAIHRLQFHTMHNRNTYYLYSGASIACSVFIPRRPFCVSLRTVTTSRSPVSVVYFHY